MRTTLILTGVLVAALLAGCADDGPGDDAAASANPDATGPTTLTADEAVEAFDFLADPDVEPAPGDAAEPALIDVRTPEEVADGHLDGAVNLDINAPDFEDRLDELDRDATYVLYCRTGNRSGQAAAIMDDLGFEAVYNIGGYAELVDAGADPAR